MRAGRVSIGGELVQDLGRRVDPVTDRVEVDGSRVVLDERRRYWLLNKPAGVVSTAADPEGRPTVVGMVPEQPRVFPVGRLDRDTEGLLLLTNDGDLAARLTHPRHGVARVYEARVLGVPDQRDLARLSRGLVIDGRRTEAADITLRPHARDAKEATLVVTIREGRNRQVRRMCEAVGHPVTHLKRVAIGPIKDSTLKVGRWRELRPEEVERLRRAAAHKPSSESPQINVSSRRAPRGRAR